MIVRKRLNVHQKEQGQICWDCQKACGECSWSRCYTPVEGWIAEFSVVHDEEGDFCSYNIISCPEFVKEVEWQGVDINEFVRRKLANN